MDWKERYRIKLISGESSPLFFPSKYTSHLLLNFEWRGKPLYPGSSGRLMKLLGSYCSASHQSKVKRKEMLQNFPCSVVSLFYVSSWYHVLCCARNDFLLCYISLSNDNKMIFSPISSLSQTYLTLSSTHENKLFSCSMSKILVARRTELTLNIKSIGGNIL